MTSKNQAEAGNVVRNQTTAVDSIDDGTSWSGPGTREGLDRGQVVVEPPKRPAGRRHPPGKAETRLARLDARERREAERSVQVLDGKARSSLRRHVEPVRPGSLALWFCSAAGCFGIAGSFQGGTPTCSRCGAPMERSGP